MKMKVWVLLIMGIWLGMIVGISFLEAPLKFQAPNITLPIGLEIGQLVFTALNRVEIFFSILLTIWLFFNYKEINLLLLLLLSSLIAIIIIQALWLLPILSVRANLIIAGQVIPKSHHHILYVIGEILKVGLLVYGFFKIYNYEGHSRQR